MVTNPMDFYKTSEENAEMTERIISGKLDVIDVKDYSNFGIIANTSNPQQNLPLDFLLNDIN